MLDNLGQRQRRSVHSGSDQSSQNGLGESGVSSSSKESEELQKGKGRLSDGSLVETTMNVP